jgi:hypothetical protein
MTPLDQCWVLTDHCCRRCLGRLLAQAVAGRSNFRCAECGAVASVIGPFEGSVCACGVQIGGRDAGIRCMPNPNIDPDSPTELIVGPEKA